MRFRYFRKDLLAAVGTAAVATFQRETGELRATGLTLRVHDRGGPIDVSAPEGDGRVAVRTFEVRGGVRAVRGDDHVATQAARFDRGLGAKGMVIGDDPVELWGPGYRLRGKGFTFDPTVQVAVLRGGTRLVTGTSGRTP